MRRDGEIKEMVGLGKGISRGIMGNLGGGEVGSDESVERWMGALEGWGKLIETMLKWVWRRFQQFEIRRKRVS